MTTYRWGIFGTGAISAKFVAGLAAARDAQACFVASRTSASAERFAAGMGIGRAIAGYAEAAAAGGVDAVYVATPPSEHAAHAISCIEAGIPVLIEKPFAANAADARRIASAARAQGVFAMEAMWTRFLPAGRALREAVAVGRIGQVRFVTGSFGTSQRPEPANGMFDRRLGGGAVAHLGAYPLSLGQWLFGTPTLVQAVGTIGETGVDEDAAIQLRYPGGTLGTFLVSLRSWAPDDFRLLGTDGIINVRGSIVRPHGLNIVREAPLGRDIANFNWKSRLRQHGLTHGIAQRLDLSSRASGRGERYPYSGNGYQYEADEVRACVERGVGESAVMPLDDSIAVADTSDTIRDAIRRTACLGSDAE